MTWCETQVARFNDVIKLDTARIARVTAAIQRLQDFCRKDDQLKVAIAGDIFLQGSVASKTVIRPLASEEFDVDAVYPFHLNAFPHGTTPRQTIEWFLSRLEQSDFYKKI